MSKEIRNSIFNLPEGGSSGSSWTLQWTTSNIVYEGHSFMVNPNFRLLLHRKTNPISEYDSSVTGSSVLDIIDRAATVDSKLITETSIFKNILILFIGANDFNDIGLAEIRYALLKTYIQDRINAGWKVFVYTSTPGDKTDSWKTERNIFNGKLKNDLALIRNVYILDTDTIVEMNDPTNVLYYSDGLHPTPLGYELLADLFGIKIYSLSFLAQPTLWINDIFLTPTGNGTGVTMQILQVSSDITVTLDGNGYFYTNAAGTLGQSQIWNVVAGADRTMYIKVTSGSSAMKFSDASKLTKFWVEGADPFLNEIAFNGRITGLNLLTCLVMYCNNFLSGNITGLNLLTRLQAHGYNNLSGSISGHNLLTHLEVYGWNTISGDLNNIVSHLSMCVLDPCAMVDYTAGATWGNATIKINPYAGYGYSATEIDNMLIDMAASVALKSKTITLKGSSAARTAASNAAVATLTGAGRTNTVVTN